MIKKVASLIAPPGLVISFIANIITISKSDEVNYISLFIMIFSAIIVFGFAIYYIIFTGKVKEESEKLKENANKIDLLEREICRGIKYSRNEATVMMDIEHRKYIIRIEKEYEIISDSIKWHECQFYCNKILTDAQRALEEYHTNPVTWKELNVQALLQYKNPEDHDYVPPVDVYVKLVAEGNNYKQFHIEYKTVTGDELDIKKETKIILKYKYEVPVSKWGSYLNRYISYWGEETKITIVCEDEQKLKLDELKLYKTNNTTGKPVIVPNVHWIKARNNDKYCYECVINEVKKVNRCCKYLVSWDANKIFNIEGVDLNTQIGEDQSQLTQY
jgi:hypothetical protein